MLFWKISPSGNPTILIPAEQVSPVRRAELSVNILSPDHLFGDQVGYYTLPTDGQPARLDMMGGEFCLNATRALAFLLAHLDHLDRNGLLTYISVSGLQKPAVCRVIDQVAWTAVDFFYLPKIRILSPKVWLIRLPGICHIVHLDPQPSENTRSYCQSLLATLDLEQENAVGFLWLDVQKMELTPLVWVRLTNSLIQESACGSGSLACALLLHKQQGLTCLDLKQPSGQSLSLNFEQVGTSLRIWVGGPVKLLAMGELFL